MVFTFDLKDKVVIITGGYGYLGKAIVTSLLLHNAKVFVLGRDRKKYEAAFLKKNKLDENLNFQFCDVSDAKSIESAFQKIFEKESKIDVLINNAFYSKGQSPEHMNDEEWNFGIDGTLTSLFKCIRSIIPYFKQATKGKIINVSSMYGLVAPNFEIYEEYPSYLNPPHYGAAKAGVIQLTKYYASYLGKYDVQVNSVTPGPFPSVNVQKAEGFINALKKNTLLDRIGKPEDLAGAFIYLASDASNFMTGQNMIIDGGWTSK
ncbi:SDR family oxidoreductase [Antarcticibacterium arcticum]|uniref:SDR family oxidoreductase n=1 Tax=Antarcticibacterium arcticum TaxID=2585771 RepID=A0A5B8YF34_9FLAO|nr:SDR family oxidoreductase [Antarcticibacterium arcticum]QED36515.1 SDR family oxidoreductase [Antarcticibacterium arcticum]